LITNNNANGKVNDLPWKMNYT